MATAATLSLTTPAPATRRGFPGLQCPQCGDSDCITVRLNNVTEFHCESCDADMTDDDVRGIIAAWQRVLDWCAAAPAVEE
jgi:hypothetical protein